MKKHMRLTQKSHCRIKHGNTIRITPILEMTELIYFSFQRGNWKKWNFASLSQSPKLAANSSSSRLWVTGEEQDLG